MRLIEQLIDKASTERQNANGVFEPYFDAELFARLIIEECVVQNQIALNELRKDIRNMPGMGIMFPIIALSCKDHLEKVFELKDK